MSDPIKEFLKSQGLEGRYARVVQFGHIDALTATYTPVSQGGIYRSPPPTGATKLRVRAGDANDTAAGVGARSIVVVYLATDLICYAEELATAGATASAYTARDVFRLIEFKVSSSGTYAQFPTFSHAADIVLEDEAANNWGVIEVSEVPRGRSQIGLYTVPLRLLKGAQVTEAYVFGYTLGAASNKTVDFALFSRRDSTDQTIPYAPAIVEAEYDGIQNLVSVELPVPLGPYGPGTDIGFLAKADTTAHAVATLDLVVGLV